MHVETNLCPEAAAFVTAMLESGRYPDIDRLLDRALEKLACSIDEQACREHVDQLIQEGLDSGPAEPLGRNWKAEVKASVDARKSA